MSAGQDVFFDIEVDGKELGRIIFRLYDHIAPKTCKNFRELATGKHGFGYLDTPIHRIVPDFMIQGGDVVNRDGTGGRSIYGATFADETFKVKHSHAGLLSMANKGYHSNTSQWFIITCAAPWLDGRNVVFGEVISGFKYVLYIQENYATDDILRRPSAKIVIADSGVLTYTSKK